MDQEKLTTETVNQATAQGTNGPTMAEDPQLLAPDPQAGGCMSATPYSPTRQPVLPSSGGLMGRNFTYRTAEKTDVRLTWERAKAGLAHNKIPAHKL